MQKWNFEKLELKDAYLITPFFADDNRGGFLKDYSKEMFEQNGIEHDLKEVFYTISKKGVVRAMHFQRIKQQAKLVRCVSGKVYDVIIDLRKDSPTFMKWQGFYLSGDNMKELYDDGIKFDDEDLGIIWPYDEIGGKDKIILSEKDKNLVSYKEFMKNYSNF